VAMCKKDPTTIASRVLIWAILISTMLPMKAPRGDDSANRAITNMDLSLEYWDLRIKMVRANAAGILCSMIA